MGTLQGERITSDHPPLLPTQYLKHMGQILLELVKIPEPLSRITHLHTLGRKRLDPELRASILADTLNRHRATGGGNHVQPHTGAELRGADGKYLAWRYIADTGDIPFLPPSIG